MHTNITSILQILSPSMLGATINIRMVTWKYLNFSVNVRLNSRVFAIEEKIRQHHGGSVHQVFLYYGVVAPENLLSDPSLTLHEAGFEGDIEGKEPEIDVWYDFSPLQSSCPLLMADPNDREQRESPYRSISRMSGRSPSPTGRGATSSGTGTAHAIREGQAASKSGVTVCMTGERSREHVMRKTSQGLEGSTDILREK
jgi:hypothetical protein